MSRPRVLITGGTGFLGKHTVQILEKNFEVFRISRSGRTEVQGDLARWNGGLNIEELKAKKIDLFLHMAGLYDLRKSHAECFLNNIVGTNNALKICDLLEIPLFVNTSSVAAGINIPNRTIKATDLNLTRPFPDPYSESKALAEKIIINWWGPVSTRINLRLGVLVGDTDDGEILRIDGPYHIPQVFKQLHMFFKKWPGAIPLPGASDQRIPLVPVNEMARAIAKFCAYALENRPQGYKSFYLTPSEGTSIETLYQSTFRFLYQKEKSTKLIRNIPETVIKKLSEMMLRLPEEELNYLFKFQKFDTSETRQILGDNWCSEFESFEPSFWRGYEKFVSHR